jgi:hypothetical protein
VAQAFIFINYHQALRFGHVAWGFALSSRESKRKKYCWGSSDHLLRTPMSDVIALAKYSHVPPGGDIDFWCEEGSFERMLESMSQGHHIQHQEIRYHINYHAYKELYYGQQSGNVERALQELEMIKAGGWSLLTNNCIDQTYRLLDAYGAGAALVDPKRRYRSKGISSRNIGSNAAQPFNRLSTLLPRKWFAAACGQTVSLEQYKPSATAGGSSKAQDSSSLAINSLAINSHEIDSGEIKGRQIVG